MQAHWPSALSHQIYLNPLVRVSYTRAACSAQNSVVQLFMERVIGPFVASVCDLRDWWLQRRLARFKAERREKVKKWERISGKQEVGEYCLIDQMQLLTPRGWVHV
jgi:hypothetical protein